MRNRFRNGAALLVVAIGFGHASPVAAQFELKNPLGFSPLDLDNRNGLLIAAGALGLSLLVSDAGEESDAVPGQIRSGAWFVTTQGEYFRSYHETPTDIYAARIGVGVHLRKWLSVGMELHGSSLEDARGDTRSLGGAPFVRWRLFGTDRWNVSFDYSFGLIAFKDEFPPGGTRTNFTPSYGLQLLYRVSQRGYLRLGVKHLHISNGGQFGGADDRNPGFDSNGVFLGYQFQF